MSILKKSIKVYFIIIVLALMFLGIYTVLLKNGTLKSTQSSVNTATLFIGMFLFFMLGFLSSNCYKKKGLIVAILHSGLVLLIFLMFTILGMENLEFSHFYKYFILFLCAAIGGIIGVNFKQIIK